MIQQNRIQPKARGLLFDWGNTLMRDFPEYKGPMAAWPNVEVMPHVPAVLARLHDQWRMALATNAAASTRDDIRNALARVRLDAWIDWIYCFRQIGHQKPSTAFFDYIVEDWALDRDRLVMVGDSFEGDILGANAAGIQGVWYNHHTAESREGPMYRTIHDFRELPETLMPLIND